MESSYTMYLTYEDIQKKKKRQKLLLKMVLPFIAIMVGLATALLGSML